MAMVVPASKHSLFFRGFSAVLTLEKVREFFTKEGGPNSAVFHKIDEMGGRLFVALRFDSSKVAEEIKERFDGQDVLGHQIQVTWFKDMRKARMLAAQRGYPQPYAQPYRPPFQNQYGGFHPRMPGFQPRGQFQQQAQPFRYESPGMAKPFGEHYRQSYSYSRSRSRTSAESSRSGSSTPRERKRRRRRRRRSSERSYSSSRSRSRSSESSASDRSRSGSRDKKDDDKFKSAFKSDEEGKEEQPSKKQRKRKKKVSAGDEGDVEDPLAQSMIGLSEDSINRVQEKKDEIEQFYRQDCETFATVVKMLVSKDPSLEEKIQDSLRQNLQEIGQRCLQELQQVISEMRAKEGLDNP